MRPHYPRAPWKNIILQPQLHPRQKFILWLASHEWLATLDRLMKMGIQVPPTCVLYGLANEVFKHLLFGYQYVKIIWTRLLKWLGYQWSAGIGKEEIQWLCKGSKRKIGHWQIINCVFDMIVYLIWQDRNAIRFQKGTTYPDRICKEVAQHMCIRGSKIKS